MSQTPTTEYRLCELPGSRFILQARFGDLAWTTVTDQVESFATAEARLLALSKES